VAVFSQPLTAGLSADALYPNWYNHAFEEEIASAQTEQNVADILLRRSVDFVILDSNWNGGQQKQDLIRMTTEDIAENGSISVRRIKADYRFKTELLNNPNFTSANGWTLAPEAQYDAGIILASVASSATQAVAVSPGRRYLNTVVARCAKKPTSGRAQINWLDAKGQFISVNTKTFECSYAWSEHIMKVTAPPNAINAVVYVTGQTSIPLEFRSNSLKQ
jgi:hypothetical protein